MRTLSSERGSALVEFALVMPLLFLLCMGATDFGRLFFHAVTVYNAASTGAFYGARTPLLSGQYAVMEQKAQEDAEDIEDISTGVGATAERRCECPGSAVGEPGTPIDCREAANPNACTSYGSPTAYVKVRAQNTFETLGIYPGIPSSTVVAREIWMRVQ
jgi:Flp pilus assembly protein TadG